MQVKMTESKTDLLDLLRLLETKQEKIIYLERNGTVVAQLTLIPGKENIKRIGIAEGKFAVPDDFDNWDKEVETLFGDMI